MKKVNILLRKPGLNRFGEKHPITRHAAETIQYLYADDKYVLAHTADDKDVYVTGVSDEDGKQLSCDTSLKQISQLLEQCGYDQFVFCHRSHLVNSRYVTGMSGSSYNRSHARAVFVNNNYDNPLPLSRRYATTFKRHFLRAQDLEAAI